MPDWLDHTPAEIRVGLEHYGVTEALCRLLSHVAAQRGLTADPPGKGYVAVRPAAWGNVSAYFHSTYVDVAITPGRAESLHRARGWKVIKANSETGFIRIESAALGDAGTNEVALHALLSAVDKSAVGTAYEGGRSSSPQVVVEDDLCPSCFVARAQGRCDVCD